MNASQTTHVSDYPTPNQLHYAVLALLFAAFTVYGSVTPLHLHPMPFTEAVERFRQVLAQPIVVKSRSDWLANFLLLVPLGFLLMGALCCDGPRRIAGLVAPIVLIACIALAVFVEFAQLYFPPRVSSINDIAAQTLGGASGILAWLLCGDRLTAYARRLWSDFGRRNTTHLLLPLYLFLLLIVQTLPFDFTLSPVEVYHKYKEGRVQLVPFTASTVGGFALANKYFWNAALFVPVGLLLAYLPGRVSRSGALAILFGLGVAAGIELAQLAALSRYFDSTDILTGGAAVFAAWYVARRFADPMERTALRTVLLAACLAALIFMEWQPFDFTMSLSQARSRLHEVSLLPFLDYLRGNYLNSLDDGIHKVLLFAPLGVFLAPTFPASRGTILFRWSLAISVAVVLEVGQLFLPTRCASLTDVLIGAAASGIALFLTCRYRNQLNRKTMIRFSV
jgi:glycopeptide antibiotics resistance protein